MIDNYAQAKELMRKMEAQLPIPVQPAKSYVWAMRERGVKIKRDQQLQIQHVFYAGDEGGIICDVTATQDAKEVQLVSLTHLEIDPHHPLAREIRAYQRERTQRIAQSGVGQKSTVTIRPRKSRNAK